MVLILESATPMMKQLNEFEFEISDLAKLVCNFRSMKSPFLKILLLYHLVYHIT